MKKIALIGAGGKMGQEITKLISESPQEIKITDLAKGVDVVIEFSSPKGFEKTLKWCVKNKTAFVSEHERQLQRAAKIIPVFWASNFSLGIALVTEMMKQFSELEDFDFQIEEFHHKHKKDKPSGTAKTLQKELHKIVQKKLPEPLSIRGGEIFGIHKIWAMSSSENILIEHSALNRSVFAKGALRASLWLIKQAPGYYSMRDLLSN
jgi:4-hydroxy-tetrahydrodipicolinate reductase